MSQYRNLFRSLWLVVSILALGAFLHYAGVNPMRPVPAAAEPAPLTQSLAPAPALLRQEEPQLPTQELLADLYDATLPSVVNIQVTTRSAASGFGLPDAPQSSEGTGWVFDDQGHIVTNNHVVEDADSILVNFSNGMWADAELVARDPQADLAVIQVEAPEGVTLRPLPLAHTPLRVGHYVVALGSPFGLDGTMTTGIVSALGRSFRVGQDAGARYALPEIIQTDAAINPGNSGGPLLNLHGEVVGVNFAIRSEVRSNSGVGFAIPVAVVQRVVPALIEEGVFTYPYLGISGAT
ncbi:MAG: 2-alkenal reductase, partial [Caldilineae bacterium]